MTKRYTFDIETNGFMPDVNKCWMVVIEDVDTSEVFSYTSKDGNMNKDLFEGLTKLSEADILIGHNIIGYDLVVLDHLFGWKPKETQRIMDTYVLSQLIQYQRNHRHSLEGWGTLLGYPKLEFNDFSKYSDEMLTYCIRDVQLNTKVYMCLQEDGTRIIKRNPLFTKGIHVEMEFAKIEADIRNRGWIFDMESALKLQEHLNGRLEKSEAYLEPLIGMRCIPKDGRDDYKEPAWRKDGCYTINTVKWFNIPIESGRPSRSGRPIEGPYCRVSFEQGKVSSIEVVKNYLYSIGWEPDEWNWDRINGAMIKKGPKLTETSLLPLGESGKLINEYYTIRSRRDILKGWIEAAQKDGRLHGRMWTIGTPTFRCRHEVVANLPSVDTEYGKEMRSLLKCEEGYSIVGADSAGNQMRGLCHYIGNEDFTEEVINGDVHQRNANALGVTRKLAKPFLYAFLFGGGAGKLGLILTGKRDVAVGQSAIEKFQDSIPGLKELRESLEAQFNKTSDAFGKKNAFIRGIDGRTIFVSSKHQVLNYLLQTLEGITCKAAIVWMKKELIKRGIPHYFALHYHDEFAVVVPDNFAEEVRLLSIESFTEAPKEFGVMCMNGDAHIGKNYAEVH
jgi:DNA polymerase-1